MKVYRAGLTALLSMVISPYYSNAQSVGKTLLRKRAPPSEEVESLFLTLVSNLEAMHESTCLNFKDENSCNGSVDNKNIECVWCKCAAVPSECLSVDQSKLLPSGVFDCASPAAKPELEHFVSETHDFSVLSDEKYDGQFIRYDLKDDIVDPNLCDPSSKSISGYIDISGSKYDADGENKHLFYWFFEKRSESVLDTEKENNKLDSREIPIILWLTGGPGCSSTMALLFENGPCTVNPEGTDTIINPYSWTEAAHVLWLDQPAGV